MNVCTYTANIGSYDHYHACEQLCPHWNNYYISDCSINPPAHWGWNNLYLVPACQEDPKRLVQRYKLLTSHLPQDHHISVWIDASVKLKCSIEPLIQHFADSEDVIRMFTHPHRRCTYQEAKVCIQGTLDKADIITRQMRDFINEGFPLKYGMVATAIILRKNTPQVAEFNAIWKQACDNGSRRDQLSVMYACWKAGISIGRMPGSLYRNRWFQIGRHRAGHEKIRLLK